MSIKLQLWVKVIFTFLCSAFIFNTYANEITVQNDEPTRRVLHFVLRGLELERAYWIADEADKSQFTTLQIVITDGVQLDHAPWKVREDAWTKKEFVEWVGNMRNRGIEIVPEIKLLTHQEKFFQAKYPYLMFNQSTYNPLIDETYQYVFAILDEIIEIIHPKAIHIGHDEVAGHNARSRKKWLLSNEKMLPAELFLKDVLILHNYLKKKNLETWIWGDMLIDPNEFPTMLAKHLHGSVKGYGKVLRDQLPRDIVICDWHYFDKQPIFPSLSTLQNEGFRVLGSTWKNRTTIHNFSKYAALHNAHGMIATTWFHVQRKDWNMVQDIIKFSGAIFSKSFPDAN